MSWERQHVDPRFVNDLLEQATKLQNKYGYGEEVSEAFIQNLPENFRLGIGYEIPSRKHSRLMTPVEDLVSSTVKSQNHSRQTLSNILHSCDYIFDRADVEVTEDIGIASKFDPLTWTEYQWHSRSQKKRRATDELHSSSLYLDSAETPSRRVKTRSERSRDWERRQRGLKADKLRINNSIRARKSQKRLRLRSTLDWESLTCDEQNRQMSDALQIIEKERNEKLERARIEWQSKHDES